MADEPRQVNIEEGVVFGTGGGRDLHCDVFKPEGLTEPAIGVVLVFGAGWVAGERAQLRGYAILLGRQGFVVVCPDYRLTGEAKWPAQIHDVKAAIRWTRANAKSLGIDPDRIAIGGNSAGGQLSLLAAGTPGREEGEGGNAGVSSTVAAVSAIYPVTSFEPEMGGAWEPALSLLEEGQDPSALREAGPLHAVSGTFPPTMLVHGTADDIVDHSQSLRMFAALEAAEVPVDLHLYAGQRHAFDLSREVAREVSGLIGNFLRRHLEPSS